MTAPAEVLQLVAKFDLHQDAYRSEGYNETQVRREFLDPLFEALGWDIQNRGQTAEAYKDVIHEDAIKIGGFTKAPDYCFRIGGDRKFFVEAKRPSIDVRQDPAPAFQLRRYAWSAKLPLSIVTNFEGFAVYDCRIRPSSNDKASTARLKYVHYKDFVTRWDEVAQLFSKQALATGAFDTFIESMRLKRGTTEVDTAFLEELEGWRVELAKNLAGNNPALTAEEVNFAVQRIIDRIIFLRICEDRGIEQYGRLQALQNGKNAYPRLVELFERADERYNSGLFHFNEEKGRTELPDELTQSLTVDDTVVQHIVDRLYWPTSPYEFSVLPVELLGQVYERFLGSVIRLTPGHRAKVEQKDEIRKAGGVYYTPAYVVDYIVRQTLGRAVAGLEPKRAAELKVLDPACGSGSFLISAYQFLLDWHRDWYTRDGTGKHRKVLYQGAGGEWRLTTKERTRILTASVYGVDVDPQAVEVTKLSLLLKVLEGGSPDALQREFFASHERVLPDLGKNIKCGNSLIGEDFYAQGQLTLAGEGARSNPFDWAREFPAVQRGDRSGFDVVVGNPPWGASFSDGELEYLRTRYARVVARMVDSYIYFIDKGHQLAKPTGRVGFVVPATLLNQADAKPVRDVLLTRGLSVLVNLGEKVFGPKVLNTSAVFVTSPSDEKINLADVATLRGSARARGMMGSTPHDRSAWQALVNADPLHTFFVRSLDEAKLLQGLRERLAPLQEVVAGAIERGLTPDVIEAHIVSAEDARRMRLEKELLRPSLSGSQIRQYGPWKTDQQLVYTTRETSIEDFPRVRDHLATYRHRITCKEVQSQKHPWWALHRPRDPSIFTSPKFVGLTTTRQIIVIYDETEGLYVTDAMYVFKTRDGVDPWALMGVLHSSLLAFLYAAANQGEGRVIPQVKAAKLGELPIPRQLQQRDLVTDLRSRVLSMLENGAGVQKATTDDDRTQLGRLRSVIERDINRLVFELYGLQHDEIRFVESALSSRQPQ